MRQCIKCGRIFLKFMTWHLHSPIGRGDFDDYCSKCYCSSNLKKESLDEN